MVSVGIIGLGAIGERLLKQFILHPKTMVAAICDSNTDRLSKIKAELEEVELYDEYKDLLANPSIDLVYVAVPPKFHHQIVLDAANAGKHVLCEKPLANSYHEAKEMLEAVEHAGVVHAINLPLAYSDAVNELKNRVTGKTIGEVKRIELKMHFPTWPRAWQQNPWIAGREQGGFIREITPHYLQLILDIFGDAKNIKTYINYPSNLTDCETSIIARMELQNGVPLLIDGLSGIGKKEEISFKIYGDKGTIALKNWSQLEGEMYDKAPFAIEVPENNEHRDLISEIIKGMNGQAARLVTFKEGFNIQKVLEQLLQSE
ncbi:Gfo/Idh/MocA family protein [Heyndrickxia sp. NPDC080065]|uniref:Gfo/Idh/MocA family protein n=1 Tax=Heyndrickxia sp. NPDC080065 TaxID=3390568 RepID=UPI003CFD2A35